MNDLYNTYFFKDVKKKIKKGILMIKIISRKKYDYLQNMIKNLKQEIVSCNKKIKDRQESEDKLNQKLSETTRNAMQYAREKKLLEAECEKKREQEKILYGKLGGYKKQNNKLKKENEELKNTLRK